MDGLWGGRGCAAHRNAHIVAMNAGEPVCPGLGPQNNDIILL
jgi:hypothetical protein